MRKYSVLAVACFMLLCALPASASVLDISGTWVIDFPQGQGLVVFQPTEGSPPGYQGLLTIPYPSRPSGKLSLDVKMISDPSSVVTGEDINFKYVTKSELQENDFLEFNNQVQNMKDELVGKPIQKLIMNLDNEECGLTWIRVGFTSDPYIEQFDNLKVPVHR